METAMEPNSQLYFRKDQVDFKIWPVFHFLNDKEIENINVAVVFGDQDGCALYVTKNDEVFSIGCNINDLSTDTNWRNNLKPKKVEQLCGKKVKYFSCGSQHIMALTEGGMVYNWGSNNFCQLGTKNPSDVLGPSIVGSLFSKKVVQIACSSFYNIVLCDDHLVYEWGKRSKSEKQNLSTETLVEGELVGKEIIFVTCSKYASFALSSDGYVYSWGLNRCGILGRDFDEDADDEEKIKPAKIHGLSGFFIKKIVTGRKHVLALSNAGIVYSWGKNDYKQLANTNGEVLNNNNAYSSIPEEIEFQQSDGSVSTKKIIDIGASHFCSTSAAMDENCNVFMWGQCREQTIDSPYMTNYKSLHEVFVFCSHFAGTFRPIVSKNLKKALVYDHIKSSFGDETTSDLTISVEGKEIKVHKAVLKIRSNYFRTMLRDGSGWKENKDNNKILEIKESTYNAYNALLEYFYTDNLNVPFDSAFELLDLARVYCEEQLQEMCEEVIKNNITTDNAASSYASSKLMRVENLKIFCLEFMMNNFSSVVVSDDFAQLDAATVIEILKAASRNYSVFKT